jgi:hypothetical protein
MKVGFAVATVFDSDQLGLHLFRVCAQGAPSYSAAACDKVYKHAGSKIGTGNVVAWLREDAPPHVADALIHMLQAKESMVDDEEKKVSPNNVVALNDYNIERADRGLADIFFQIIGTDIMVTDATNAIGGTRFLPSPELTFQTVSQQSNRSDTVCNRTLEGAVIL